MKTNSIVWLLALSLYTVSFRLQAQTQGGPDEPPPKRGLQKIGATFGIGAANLNLDALNSRLQQRGVGHLEPSLTTFNVGVYAEINGGIGASLDVGTGAAFGSMASAPLASLTLRTLSLGANLHYPLLNTDRVRLQVLGGPRLTDMRLVYNANTVAPTAFDDLLTDPAANGNAIALESVSDGEAVALGARLQYRLGKKGNLKRREYTAGIDAGYSLSFGATHWREARSKAIVQDMPATSPDHFYLILTLSAFLLR